MEPYIGRELTVANLQEGQVVILIAERYLDSPLFAKVDAIRPDAVMFAVRRPQGKAVAGLLLYVFEGKLADGSKRAVSIHEVEAHLLDLMIKKKEES